MNIFESERKTIKMKFLSSRRKLMSKEQKAIIGRGMFALATIFGAFILNYIGFYHGWNELKGLSLFSVIFLTWTNWKSLTKAFDEIDKLDGHFKNMIAYRY